MKFRARFFRTGDSRVHIFTIDFPAAPGSVLSQFGQLHLWTLSNERAHSRINRNSHRSPPRRQVTAVPLCYLTLPTGGSVELKAALPDWQTRNVSYRACW